MDVRGEFALCGDYYPGTVQACTLPYYYVSRCRQHMRTQHGEGQASHWGYRNEDIGRKRHFGTRDWLVLTLLGCGSSVNSA